MSNSTSQPAALQPATSQIAAPKTGRPPVLGHDQRKRIITLLTAGCSRRAAARAVRCAPSTIANTARRDGQFAEDVAHAEANLETDLLEAVRNAAKVGRHWRAASWLLERKYPLDYTPDSLNCYAPAKVEKMVREVFEALLDDLTPEQCDRVFQKIDELLEGEP